MSAYLRTALLVGAGLAAISAASAQDQVTLRVADHYSPTALTPKYTIGFFMDYVTERAGDRVAFEYYPAEQLGKAADMLSLTEQGVIDISLVAAGYVSDRMPLSAVSELPGTYATACEGTRAYWEMAKGGQLAELEFEANGVKPLLAFLLPPYQILTREPLETIADLEGQKLRSGGTAQDITIGKLGAVPVRMGGVEVYEGLSRGTLDGAVFPLQSAIDFRLPEILKASTRNANFGGFASTYSMSLDAWEALPDDLKELFREAGDAAVEHACSSLDGDNSGPAIERLEGMDVTVSEMSPELAAAVQERLATVHQEWAAGIDGRGLPGTEILEDFLGRLGTN